jgi:hypothetical protein
MAQKREFKIVGKKVKIIFPTSQIKATFKSSIKVTTKDKKDSQNIISAN